MDTLSGEATQAGNGYIVQQNYSGVRHVSLTFYCWGIDCFNDEVYVFVGRMFGINYRIAEVNPTNYNSNYVVNVQFDADSWEIWANNGGPLEIYVAYKATVTYPR
jgi:hypothetical protein